MILAYRLEGEETRSVTARADQDGPDMTLLRTIGGNDADIVVEGRSLYLRYPVMSDFDEWADLRGQSRAFLQPWEPTWPADDLTRGAFRRRLRRYGRHVREGVAHPFFVFRNDDHALLGGITLSNIRRGVTQSCSIGYWIGEPHARRGYMKQAVIALVPFVFEGLGLHRIEAACLPENEASRKLLKGAAFEEEGFARNYLKINGIWKDHVLFARIREDGSP